jgi:hypothetical protein
MPHKVRRAVGVAGLGLGLIFAMAPAASAGSNGANIGGVAASVPVVVCGNAINVVGIGAAAHCAGVNGPTSSIGVLHGDDEAGMATPLRAMAAEEDGGNTAHGLLDAGDSNGANVGGIAATVPVLACGNAANVLGGVGAGAHCRGVNGGHGGNPAEGVLLGDDSNGLNVGGIAAAVPIVVCGNAANVLGGIGAEAHCEGTNG